MEVEFKTVPRGSEPHLHPIQWVQGSEIHHFPSCGAEVKNEWSYTFASPIYLCGGDRDNFTFRTVLVMLRA